MVSYGQFLLGSTRHDEGVKKAAWQLEDALNRGKIVEAYPSKSEARETYFVVASSQYDFGLAMVIMILLTLFETPVWCNTQDNFFHYMHSHERCRVTNDHGVLSPLKWNFSLPNGTTSTFDTVLLSNVPYIPPGIGLVLEAYIMCVAARKFLLERKLQLRYFRPLDATYCDARVATIGLIMVALDLVDCFAFAMWRPKFRVAFVARTVILCTLPGVRSLLLCALDVVKSVGSILTILVGSILFFAWIAVTIFDDVDESIVIGGESIFPKVNEGMDAFTTTVYTMFVAGNTDEFVDCLLPTYSKYRWSGYLWFFFLTMVQILFLNMVLDTLVVTYLDNTEQEGEKENKRMVQGMRKSFHTITDAVEDAGVTESSFLDLVKELSRSPASKTISSDVAGYLFKAVKEEASTVEDQANLSEKSLNEGEFLRVCALLDCQCWTTQKDSPVKEVCPWIWERISWLRKKVTDGDDSEDPSSFDEIMNTVLMLNLVMVVLETSYELNDKPKPTVLDSLELIFSFAYVMEVGVKLCVYSWAEYSSSGSNLFDFATTWLLLLSSMLEEVLKGVNFNAKRYMNILRLLRLVRVVKQLKRYKSVQFMIKTIGKLVTSSTDLLSLLGIVVYFFMCLSVQLWGGLLHYDSEKLGETEYRKNNWLVLNFNDSLTAFGAWVVMLLCEYVPKYAEAVYSVTETPYNRTWLIFLVFYFCGVCIVFELVKAFTIEVFLACLRENKNSEGSSEIEPERRKPAGKRSLEKEMLWCFCVSIEDEIESNETAPEAGNDELKGFKIIKDKLKEEGLCLHYTSGNNKRMKELHEEFVDQIEEEAEVEKEKETKKIN